MMVLGSGGRGESLLAMDQDNAIVFAKASPKAPKTNGSRGARHQSRRHAGCRRGLLLQGRHHGQERRVAHERRALARYGRRMDAEIRPKTCSTVTFSLMQCPYTAKEQLARELRREAMEAAREQKIFLKNMSIKAAEFKSPLGFMGRISARMAASISSWAASCRSFPSPCFGP